MLMLMAVQSSALARRLLKSTHVSSVAVIRRSYLRCRLVVSRQQFAHFSIIYGCTRRRRSVLCDRLDLFFCNFVSPSWYHGGLFTNAGRTYDTTAVVRRGSQLRYDLFTELVASGDRIVRTIRPCAVRKCRSITIVYISICGADR